MIAKILGWFLYFSRIKPMICRSSSVAAVSAILQGFKLYGFYYVKWLQVLWDAGYLEQFSENEA